MQTHPYSASSMSTYRPPMSMQQTKIPCPNHYPQTPLPHEPLDPIPTLTSHEHSPNHSNHPTYPTHDHPSSNASNHRPTLENPHEPTLLVLPPFWSLPLRIHPRFLATRSLL